MIAVLAFASISASGVSRAATDAEVKAALLLGIAQLSEWKKLPDDSDAFRICLVGESPLEIALQAASQGETANDRRIEIQRISAAAEGIGLCQLVFVPADAASRFSTTSAARLAETALIVGEHPDFATGPGAINFFVEDGRVGFEVNRLQAQRAGVRLSSRILRRARFVGGLRDES